MILSQTMKRIYNKKAIRYNKRYIGAMGKYFRKLEWDIVLNFGNFSGRYILDVGTGTGEFLLKISDVSKMAIGIEVSARMMDIAKSKLKDKKNITLFLMDLRELGFKDCSFDIVTSIGTFECFSYLSHCLKEIKRVLKPDGLLIFTYWNADQWLNWKVLNHRRLKGSSSRSMDDLDKELKENGFEPQGYTTSFFTPGILLFGLSKILAIEMFRRIYIDILIRIEKKLQNLPITRDRGRVLIVSAKVTEQNQRLYSLNVRR